MEYWLMVLALVVLVLLVAILPSLFKWLGLTNSLQALGLPEGSVRALIAFVLIVLFCVAPIYLFNSLSGHRHVIEGMDLDTMNAALGNSNYLEPEATETKSGEKPQDRRFSFSYKSAADGVEIDFAKQLLILLGTLATSVTGFYFGAQIASSASAKGAAQAAGPPTATRLDSVEEPPPGVREADKEVTFGLKLNGIGLNNVRLVKIVSGDGQKLFQATSTDNRVVCDVKFMPKSTTLEDWRVSVLDGNGTELAGLPNTLKF